MRIDKYLFGLIILSGLIIWPLFNNGYFSHQDDLQIMRIFEMKKCIQDLQIPCRWVPDMGYGNGYPLFNYYNPFPYYLGGLLSFFVGFIISAKILFLIPLILGGVSMYLLSAELFGRKAGFFAGVLYLFAPYRALDTYVRGALAESIAISLIPFVFYFILKLIKKGGKKNLILFSVSLAAFLTSHNIMTLLFAPLVASLSIFWVWSYKRNLKSLMMGFILGFGLSAFFILPAYFEKNLVQIDNLTRLELDFRAHFITVSKLFFDRSWDFENLSFQIGWPYWILAFISIPFVLVFKREEKKFIILYLIVFLFFLFSIFMTHNKSAFIWEKIGILRFTQFPWRFLAITIFTSSLLGGFLVYSFNNSFKKALILVLTLITIYLNWNYFRPQYFFSDLTDQNKLTGEQWETQQKAAILDYLPVGSSKPLEKAPDYPIIREGEAVIKNFDKKSNRFKLDLEIKSASKIEIPIFDFPNWTVYENGQKINYSTDNYVKRITLDLSSGTHSISGKFNNTPIRTLANVITLISILGVFYYGKKDYK